MLIFSKSRKFFWPHSFPPPVKRQVLKLNHAEAIGAQHLHIINHRHRHHDHSHPQYHLHLDTESFRSYQGCLSEHSLPCNIYKLQTCISKLVYMYIQFNLSCWWTRYLFQCFQICMIQFNIIRFRNRFEV